MLGSVFNKFCLERKRQITLSCDRPNHSCAALALLPPIFYIMNPMFTLHTSLYAIIFRVMKYKFSLRFRLAQTLGHYHFPLPFSLLASKVRTTRFHLIKLQSAHATTHYQKKKKKNHVTPTPNPKVQIRCWIQFFFFFLHIKLGQVF